MRKKIASKNFYGNTKSQLFPCEYLDILDDPCYYNQIPSNTNSRYCSLEPDYGFENRFAHNIARTASFKKFYQEIPGAKLNGKKSSVKNFFESLGIPCENVLFLEVLKDTVPFATGSCREFKVDVVVEWKAPKVSLRKLFFAHYVFSSGYELIFTLVGQFCK